MSCRTSPCGWHNQAAGPHEPQGKSEITESTQFAVRGRFNWREGKRANARLAPFGSDSSHVHVLAIQCGILIPDSFTTDPQYAT